MMRNISILAIAILVAAAVPAGADIVISKDPTLNMTCSGGVCYPTATDAVLNVNDLETMLGSGDLEIASSGGKHANAKSIDVNVPVSWGSGYTLSLFAQKQISVQKKISVSGTGGLVLFYGTAFVLQPKGAISFSSLSSTLTIEDYTYQLVGSLSGLATAIAANPSGRFALANSYDASADGTYSSSPVTTNFLGVFEGLGNTISNISVNNTTACCVGGLFENLSVAYISDLHLKNVSVVSTGGAAGLAYESFARINSVSVTGAVTGGAAGDVGGIVADNYDQIVGSSSTASVSAPSSMMDVNAGGLAGVDYGSISESFATGNVSGGDGSGNIGGLAGLLTEGGSIQDSYANGAVSGGAGVTVGGLLGRNTYFVEGDQVFSSYSIGAVSGGSGSIVGGFIGENDSLDVSYDYWDTTTSGTNVGVALGNTSGVVGLTTEQLQSGLPPGFYAGIWRESADINNGLPYLKANPPPK
jgi:hypothetical protein